MFRNLHVPRPRSGAFSESEADTPLYSHPSDLERFNAVIALHQERYVEGLQNISIFAPSAIERRLIVVSNRLPVTVSKDENGEYRMRKSTGGLASALAACENLHMTLVGWPGSEIPIEQQDKVSYELYHEHNCIPVFLSHEEIELYYNGFSNGVLWPLFHYVTPGSISGSCEKEWQMYKSVNEKFAQTVAARLLEDPSLCPGLPAFHTGDSTHPSQSAPPLIWIHDYHLMLVPKYLRALVSSSAKIGWFLHTPFPSSELFRMLPYREELLTGILSSDNVGFQVPDYSRHFLSSCAQVMDLAISVDGVNASEIGGPSFVRIDAVPIGIDPQAFVEAAQSSSVKARIDEIRTQFEGKRIILGVDRLDYMKGIQHKFFAYEMFLNQFPEWQNECVLIQLAVPSRGECKEYQKLRKHVHELVGEICGKFSDLAQRVPPVVYLDKAVDSLELTALYRSSDVMLITSIRDGMNLVAFEYVASQRDRYGVLVLSEFAGAYQQLSDGALGINPWNLEETSDAIKMALEMPLKERESRHETCFAYVNQYTAQRWAKKFLCNMESEEEAKTHEGAVQQRRGG